jgi:acyl carrier protein
VFEELKQLIAAKYQLDPAKVTREVTLDELGLDSLDVVELAMVIETTWGMHVTDDELNEAGHVGGVIALMESRVARI